MGGVVRGEAYSVCPLDPSEWRVELYGESTAKKSLVLLPTWACSRIVWTTDECFLKNYTMQADEMALWEKSLPPGLIARFHPWKPRGRRREPTPASYPLWHMHPWIVHTYTVK